jgi:hypothetical protein
MLAQNLTCGDGEHLFHKARSTRARERYRRGFGRNPRSSLRAGTPSGESSDRTCVVGRMVYIPAWWTRG